MMADWQPISTAPKDGVDVLTYRRQADLMAVTMWYPSHGWCVSDGCNIKGVTHWKPLPAAPKEATDGDR